MTGEYAEDIPPLYPSRIACVGVSSSVIWMSEMAKKCRSAAVRVTDEALYADGIRSSLFRYSSPSPYFHAPYPYSE